MNDARSKLSSLDITSNRLFLNRHEAQGCPVLSDIPTCACLLYQSSTFITLLAPVAIVYIYIPNAFLHIAVYFFTLQFDICAHCQSDV